jgi:hypothetical protein
MTSAVRIVGVAVVPTRPSASVVDLVAEGPFGDRKRPRCNGRRHAAATSARGCPGFHLGSGARPVLEGSFDAIADLGQAE